jgi:hypothetical protein
MGPAIVRRIKSIRRRQVHRLSSVCILESRRKIFRLALLLLSAKRSAR